MSDCIEKKEHNFFLMESIPPYLIRDFPLIDESQLKVRIAIDKSQIAPVSNLGRGEEISMNQFSINRSPLPIEPFNRAIKSRMEASLSEMPLIVTQLAQSGPDSDFTMSIESLSTIVTALNFGMPLNIVFYNFGGQFYFDEPLHHESHPWSQLFVNMGLHIETTSAENITLLNAIALKAFDEKRPPKWFSSLKGDLVNSERSLQRWFRDSEKFLPKISEDFSRSYFCATNEFSLHVGSNAVLCQTQAGEIAFMRYCKNDPTEIQNCKWALESVLSSCHKILLTSSENMKLTKFEEIDAPTPGPKLLSAIGGLIKYIKQYSTEDGCYLLHKMKNSNEVIMKYVSTEDLEQSDLIKSYNYRASILQMIIGFRQSLSTNKTIVEKARLYLFNATEFASNINIALCFERIADSLILPILLLDRNSSLIIATQSAVEQISELSFQSAINNYEQASLIDNLPESLITSLNHKIATALFAWAVRANNDNLAERAMKIDEVTQEFKYKVVFWRGMQALKTNSDKAIRLAHLAITLSQNEEETIESKRLLANAINSDAELNVSTGRYTRAYERFQAAHDIFESINDAENLAITEANLAHIERCRADFISTEKKDEFTQEEEGKLFSAAKLYLCAIDRVKNDKKLLDLNNELRLNLASLYRSILIRYTQSPPVNRVKISKLIEEAERCAHESSNLLNGLDTNSTEVQRQIAALNTWHAKFISEFELEHESKPNRRQNLVSSAKAMFSKARQFFIADNYPADYIIITLSMSRMKLKCGEFLDAMRTTLDCLRALRPTSIAIRHNSNTQTQLQSQSRASLNQMLPSVLENVREILKEMLLDKAKRKQPIDLEKALYGKSLQTKEDNVVNLLIDIKKSLKL